MVMDWKRLFRHLWIPRWQVHRVLPKHALAAIEAAIRQTEATHDGQICFAVESALEILPLLRGVSARERALDLYAQLRVWDTERNNGVLIYVLLADHDVEILADRGIHRHVGAHAWEQICQTMEQAFRDGNFEAGALAGIKAVGEQLARHYPRTGEGTNEVPDRPVIL